MGTITISVDDVKEKEFRKAVKNSFGEGKGKLGKAITQAMEKWTEETQQWQLRKKAIERLEKGYKMGKILYKERSELYER